MVLGWVTRVMLWLAWLGLRGRRKRWPEVRLVWVVVVGAGEIDMVTVVIDVSSIGQLRCALLHCGLLLAILEDHVLTPVCDLEKTIRRRVAAADRVTLATPLLHEKHEAL